MAKSDEPTTKRRSRGRPRRQVKGTDGPEAITRETVIATAVELTKRVHLNDVSFVQIARELGATPGSIHYYAGTRDQLTSTIINSLYRRIYSKMNDVDPSLSWQETLACWMMMFRTELLKFPGIASYIATHSRFRVFQEMDGAEQDYGRLYFDCMLTLFKHAGFTPKQTAQCVHLVHSLVVSNSYGELEGVLPNQGSDALRARVEYEQAAREPAEGLLFALEAFVELDVNAAFEEGIRALIARFEAILEEN